MKILTKLSRLIQDIELESRVSRNVSNCWSPLTGFQTALVGLLICLTPVLSAQPANDNWANASVIQLGNDNLDTGTFQGDTIDLSDAANEAGEYIQNPTYSKTVWYKFSIPTHRSVRILVLQPADILQSTDAGFFVYSSSATIPSENELATFTPMFSLSSYSENVCLEPGDYYIQVVAKSVANSEVFVEMLVESTYPVSTSVAADNIDSKQDLGVLGYNNNHAFNWSCLSIESVLEYPIGIGPDSLNFTKSVWYQFDTDDHIDLLSFILHGGSNGQDYYIRFYEGDIGLDTLDNVTAFYESFYSIQSYNNQNWYTQLECLFEPNQSYTVQIIGQSDYSGNTTFRLNHLGWDQITGAYPQEADFNVLNQFGALIPTPDPGTIEERFDYFSCEALLSNDSIQCGTANPADTVVYNGNIEYDLTMWFTLSTTAASNATFRARQRMMHHCNSDYYNHGMRIRIFHQVIDNDCDNYNFPNDIYYDGAFNNDGLVILNCLPEGDYAIQLLGRSRLNSNPYQCNASQFGRRINLSLTLKSVPQLEYGLEQADDLDWINGGAALEDGVQHFADSAYFSCEKTVLPDTAICNDLADRGIYRQFIIDDSDADGVADSGLVVIANYNYRNDFLNQRVKSVFYKGDANQLAQDQNVFDWPEFIEGLDPYDGCNMYNTYTYGSSTYNVKKYCVTPGTYTLVSVGDSTENGAPSYPDFTFSKSLQSQFADPDNPENLGDIIAQGLSVTGQTDYFTCLDNPADVGGIAPCGGFTKQLYREFYLSEDCRISVNEQGNNNSPYNRMRLYQGRVSDVGVDGVSLAPYHTTSSGSCYSSHYNSIYSLPQCVTLPAGWYTVVSYGFGPSYDNNHEFHEQHTYSNYGQLYSIHRTSYITVNADTTEQPGPFFNRPYKACLAADTISYENTASDDYPSHSTTYTLCTERFKTVTDTPYVDLPIVGCPDTYRLSYFVFTTDEEYYLRIGGINGFYKELYPLNALTDSLLFPDTEPLVNCDANGNLIEICRLQPGTYTLVVYGTAGQDCNVTFTPSLTVSPVEKSRFDFAAHAYDFGLVPDDGAFIGGKPGDVHPTHPNRLPSDDIYYCTTGAFQNDPVVSCDGSMYDPIYPDSINNVYHNEPGTQPAHKRRNLWYTFVVQGMGTGTVRVTNHTGSAGNRPALRVYRSDVDGELPFDQLLALGELDSVETMGLTSVAGNTVTYCGRVAEASFTFISDICVVDTIKRRYYVVADISEYYNGSPNKQIDIQVKWDPINANPIDPKYDFYHQANVLGNGETDPPYTEIPLNYDELYSGGWGNLSCATADVSDNSLFNNNCAQENRRSLWWKLIIDEPGFLFMGIESDGTSVGQLSRNLLEQVVPGDSIISPGGAEGLLNLGGGSSSSPGNGTPNYSWRRYCLSPGTYYYNISRCASVDTSNVRAHVYFKDIVGDHCGNAVSTSGATVGSYPVSVPVTCHTMGGDFGEDGSNMNCLLGPDGYESTWFQFSYTGIEAVDILFQLNLSQLSNYIGAGNVRYRLFSGDDCSTMIEGQECSTNAFINNSIACVSAEEGDFYVQVVYPDQASGTIGYTFTVSPNSNPDCTPFDPTILTSDFYHQMNCTGDSLVFTNYASSGSSLIYLWDMGWNNFTTTETNPVFAYPNPGTYTVSLSVINPALEDTATSSQEIYFEVGGSPLDLGDDVTVCAGESATIGQFISLASYEWSTGAATPEIDVSEAGSYVLEILLNGCYYSDTIEVDIIDLEFDLGPDVQICLDDSLNLDVGSVTGANYNWSDGTVGESATFSEEGTIWLLASAGNCTYADTLNLSVLDLTFDLGNDTTICLGTEITLKPMVDDEVDFMWSTGAMADSIQVNSTDLYGLEISKDGCSAQDEMWLNVLDLQVDLGSDSVLCAGTTIDLIPWSNAQVNHLWNNGSNAPTINVNAAGSYAVTVDTAGCFATDSIALSLLDLSFELDEDTTICAGADLLIDPQVLPNVNYSWSTGESDSAIVVSTPGTYTLEISQLHCSESSEMTVDVLNLAFDLGNDTTICFGSDIQISPVIYPGANYSWSNGNLTLPLTSDTAGVFELELELMGCQATDAIEITVFEVNAQLPEEITVCYTDTTAVEVAGVDSLQWTNGSGLYQIVAPLQFEFFPLEPTVFNWVAHESGCVETGVMSAEILQPFVPVLELPDSICENHSEAILLEDLPLTSGSYFFQSEMVESLLPELIPPGSYAIDYQYADTNNCPWQIEVPFTIHDTTLTSFTQDFDPLCIDAQPLDLTPYSSHGSTDYYVAYNGTDWIETNELVLDQIPDFTVNPESVPIMFIHTNQWGCTSQINSQLVVHPLPQIEAIVPDICQNEPLNIENNTWVNGSELSQTVWNIETQPETYLYSPEAIWFEEPDAYNYILYAESEIGCTEFIQGSFLVHPVPESNFSIEGHCTNLPVVFTSQSTIAYGNIEDYHWWFNEGEETFGEEYIHEFEQWGDYQITLSSVSEMGCSDSLSIDFNVFPPPAGSIQSTDHCLENETTISAESEIPIGSVVGIELQSEDDFLWEDIYSGTHTFENHGHQIIHLTLESDMGCVAIFQDTLMVYPLPEPAFTADLDSLCVGDIVRFNSTSTIAAPSTIDLLLWDFSDGHSFTAAQGENTGLFAGPVSLTLTAISDFGCSSVVEVPEVYEVMPLPVPGFTVDPDKVHIATPFVQLTDQSEGSVAWEYEIGDGSWYSAPSPLHNFDSTGNYTIHQLVYTDFGCRAESEASVIVHGYMIYIPNAFTPNADGTNEIFKPVIYGETITEYEFLIVNRYGQQVFRSSDPNHGWNGSGANESNHYGSIEVYNYYIHLKGENSFPEEFRGSVTLIR